MKPDWVLHYNRIGECFRNPSEARMKESIEDALSNEIDIEHISTWIECGSDAGPLVTYTVSSGGRGLITTYSDSDMTVEISVVKKNGLTLEIVLADWQKLIETGAI